MSQWIDNEEVHPFGVRQPPLTLHAKLSFIKSGIRIFGFALLPWHIITAALVLILAEFIGIIEEIGE